MLHKRSNTMGGLMNDWEPKGKLGQMEHDK